MDGDDDVRSSHGDTITPPATVPPPASRSARSVASTRLPPALSPASTTLPRATPCPSSHAMAASASSRWAGYGCSGASRYSSANTSRPDASAIRAITSACVRGEP